MSHGKNCCIIYLFNDQTHFWSFNVGVTFSYCDNFDNFNIPIFSPVPKKKSCNGTIS